MRQRLGHARPALRPVRVTCRMFPLVTALPSTHSAARRGTLFAGFFGTMAMSDCSGPYITGVGVCLPCADHPTKAWPVLSSPGSRLRSVHACWGSQTAQSPRSTRVSVLLDIAFHPPTSVGALDKQLSRRNTPPTCSPTDFSSVPSRRPPHGSGPEWFARPSPEWTCTIYSLPVSRQIWALCHMALANAPPQCSRASTRIPIRARFALQAIVLV
jgi:hypothetical protein